MKKILVIMVPVAILGLLFAGCANFSNITTPGTTQEGFSYIAKGGPTEDEADSFPLYAGQDMLVGEVLVWDDGETLCIKYQLSDYAIDDGWLIYETHLAVADDLSGIPTNRPGNPIPGLFPYGDDNLEGVESYEECISFEELEIVCDDVIVIAAHAVVKRQVLAEDCWETVWQIGDVETYECANGIQLTNYADEFNWGDPADPCTMGPTLSVEKPDFANPFVVGVNTDDVFPFNSNTIANYATDFNVQWNGELPFGGILTISWSPGNSADEKKEISGDGISGTEVFTSKGIKDTGQGWFMDQYLLVENKIILGTLGADTHEINFKHTKGDGTFWDWIRLERPCVKEESETAWGAVEQGKERFVQRGNWATYFNYTIECPCAEPVLVNGDFEFPVVDTTQGWQIYPSGTEGLGWTVKWMPAVEETFGGLDRPDPAYLELHRAGVGEIPSGWTAYDGSNQYAELDTDWDGPGGSLNNEQASVKIYQDIPTCGQTFTLKYAWSPRPDHDDNKLEVYWKGALIATHEASGVGNAGTEWTLETHTNLTSNPNSTTRLEFRETGNPDSFGMFLDAVSIEVQ